MRLQPFNLLLHRLQIIAHALQVAARPALPFALLDIAKLLALIIQQLLQFPLDQRGLRVPLPALFLFNLSLDLGDLLVQFRQLLLQPDLLPLGIALRRTEIRASRLEPAPAEAGEVLIAELGFAPRRGLVVGLGGPAGIAGRVDLVVDLVALEAGAEGGGDGARDAEAFVPVVEDVEECEAGVLVDRGRGRGVDEVPG